MTGTFIAGLGFPIISDNTAETLKRAKLDGYDFVTTALPSLSDATPRADITTLESKWWSTSVVGAIDSNILSSLNISGDNVSEDTTGSVNLNPLSLICHCITMSSDCTSTENMLYQMVEWACHMNIPAIILPPVPTDPIRSAPYAQALSSLSAKCSASNVQIWVRVPYSDASLEAFQLLHRRCDDVSNMGCIIVVDSPLEMALGTCGGDGEANMTSSLSQNLSLLHRFVGSNTRAISFSTSVFLTNKRGYPTLSKSLQNVFSTLLRRIGRTIRVMLEGEPAHHLSSTTDDIQARGQSGCLSYLQYLRHLRGRDEVSRVLDSDESNMENSYLDHLQNALQPLGDNLEFQVYETFESDPVKYQMYRAAIELALRDGMHLKRFNISSKNVIEITILVVGAGRGPLVKMCLEAVSKINKYLVSDCLNNEIESNIIRTVSQVKPLVIAIEKNPSAVLYLHSLRSQEAAWQGTVEVVKCDMRYASSQKRKYPVLARMIEDERYKADLVVSELLGSFGDNELSPECLVGAQCCGLMKRTCVSIPQRYTSFLAPVSSMTLHSKARAQAYSAHDTLEGPAGKPCGILQAMETPYVVRTHSASQTHQELPCWEFSHPTLSENKNCNQVGMAKDRADSPTMIDAIELVNNNRHAQITFSPEIMDGTKYGCGYGPVDTVMDQITTKAAQDGATVVAPNSITVHGFLGTFHCMLYQSIIDDNHGVVISIAPSTFSKGMFSWFPLYFPLREPLKVPAGASICCNMWRKTDGTDSRNGGRVWYEWCADVCLCNSPKVSIISSSPVHNPYGRSSYIRL